MLNPLESISSPVCVECDYSLVGLPPGARCPECGAPAEPSVISLRGWSRGDPTTMRPRDAAISAISVAAYALWWTFGGFPFGRQLVPPVWMMILVVWYAAILVRRWFFLDDAHAPVRLRLSPAGLEQRVGPGPLKLTPWHHDMRLSMRLRKNRRQTLVIRWALHHFSLGLRSELIQFEFESEIAEARALEQRIEQWISAAAGPLCNAEIPERRMG